MFSGCVSSWSVYRFQVTLLIPLRSFSTLGFRMKARVSKYVDLIRRSRKCYSSEDLTCKTSINTMLKSISNFS